jgi:hypothetical protein
MGRRIVSCNHKWNFETVPCGYCTLERLFGKKDMKRKIEYWVTYITSEYSECAGEEHCFDKFDTLEDAEEFALNFDNFVEKDVKHIFVRKVFVRV